MNRKILLKQLEMQVRTFVFLLSLYPERIKLFKAAWVRNLLLIPGRRMCRDYLNEIIRTQQGKLRRRTFHWRKQRRLVLMLVNQRA